MSSVGYFLVSLNEGTASVHLLEILVVSIYQEYLIYVITRSPFCWVLFLLVLFHFINLTLLFHAYLCGIVESCLQSVCMNVFTRNLSTGREAAVLGEKDRVSSGAQWVIVLLAKAVGIRSLQVCRGGCLECWGQECGERWRVCLRDDSASRGTNCVWRQFLWSQRVWGCC